MSKLMIGVLVITVLVIGFAFSTLASAGGPAPATLGSQAAQGVQARTAKPAAALAPEVSGVQEVSVRALATGGYDKPQVKVKKGVPVKFTFSADLDAGCGKALYIPDFGVQLVSRKGESVSATFTPTKDGVFAYRCGMNMFRGQLIVGDAVAAPVEQNAGGNSPAGSCGSGGGGCGCGGF